MRSMNLSHPCVDAWGNEIRLRQEPGKPTRYVIWSGGREPKDAEFVHDQSHWRRFPAATPP
jgi:hypothetical protein